MEWNEKTLEFLSQRFLDTLSPNPEARRDAERLLFVAAKQSNYGLAVLRLIAEPSIDEQTRQAAAFNFKNHICSRWLPCAADSGISPIRDSEKEQINTLIFPLTLSSSRLIQTHLNEALAIISALAGHYASVNGILRVANTIFNNFRHHQEGFLEIFAPLLQELFLKTDSLINCSAGGSAAMLTPLLESQSLCCRIFFYLNFQELPEFFKDHMNEWMGVFNKCLSCNYPSLESTADGLELVDDLRSAVCDNINLYMDKYEEEFQRFVEGFALAVCTLLREVSKSPIRDQLATRAINFLTTVSTTSAHHALFAVAGDNGISDICQSSVIPNLSLREKDKQLFEMDFMEFIRRDMDGNTRRRIACELLKGLATYYKPQVTQVVSHEIHKLLSSFATNPAAQWKDKDCAIYLVLSLATNKKGAFFANFIIPELQSPDVNSYPMLKAGSLKFLTMFRSHLPKPFAMQLFPELVRFLQAESKVVHSYAAMYIEKLLLLKDEGGRSRYVGSDISPFLLQLMTSLFDALNLSESEENQYIIKCIMRVLGVAEITREVVDLCLGGLTTVFSRNPKNPTFNHYIFESVAVLVRRACERDISLITEFDSSLFPRLKMILADDVREFIPYAFQLLAQLVELNIQPISPDYMEMFLLLIAPNPTNSWRSSHEVPALVRLLQAFLQKAPHEVTQKNLLGQVLGVFDKLVKTPSTVEQGCYVLNTVIEYMEYGVIAPYMTFVWSSLFTHLEQKKSVKLQKCLVMFISLFLVKHGPANLVETMNAVQRNIFIAIVDRFWIPDLKLIMGTMEVKLTAVAATRLICETPALLDPAASKLWGGMVNSIVTLVSRPEQERAIDEPEMPEISENVGYTAATFVNLYNVGRREVDPLQDITDPKQLFVTSLAMLSASHPGRYPWVIRYNLEKANQDALIKLCTAYNCAIV
ncbi:hypothetical protein Bca52824_051423 [Brassica carinata]|uniref:Importin N-terminal domain-containing protein n=1 Tax=Brassica carinata TaxID=52824 RepID=A0A8X7R5D9_BRACI|nr:hypothetical protein Bca52824_051423 [Brassica carinata]